MRQTIILAPSVLSADFSDIVNAIKEIENSGAEWVHLDVMDGNFVPNITFGPKFIADIRPHSKLFYDAHLMISNPQAYLEEFAKAGCDAITVHYEACPDNARDILKKIKDLGCKAGISVKPQTPVSAIEDLLDLTDIVLIMSVNPGFGGQSFMPETMEKVRELKKLKNKYSYLISVDGGINKDTADIAKQAGIDVAVAGSAFFNSKNKKEFADFICK